MQRHSIDYGAMGRQIKQWRHAKGMTQGQLSKVTGISLSFLGHIERGSRKASIETLITLSVALGTTPDALLIDTLNAIASDGALDYRHLPVPYEHLAQLCYISELKNFAIALDETASYIIAGGKYRRPQDA